MRRDGSAVTSISPETQTVSTEDLGSLVVQAGRGTYPRRERRPHLLACSLGDGTNGPEGTATAIEQVLVGAGLPLGEGLVHAAQQPIGPAGAGAGRRRAPPGRGARPRGPAAQQPIGPSAHRPIGPVCR
ncbi:DUF5949 family protein [Streptomyces sp. AK010]|uniref:DUF5949 family protein n=1 Tax=Streptomyces sp. AK010 TaxID=2723074 RepID=UPI00289323AA|nr:DUF5949 family protein [Streptomyces sp. AK010]